MSASREPRNPFYGLLLLSSVLFVLTALAYGIVPVLEQKALDAGQVPPPSPFRESLHRDGGVWLLWEWAAMALSGVASMVLDRLRSLKKRRAAATIAPPNDQQNRDR
jgi:hypothetical protein